jgi:hypothetical protein
MASAAEREDYVNIALKQPGKLLAGLCRSY